MTPSHSVFVTKRAAREISRAAQWWRENRTAAPGLLEMELRRAFELLAVQPKIGARALNTKLAGVRRAHLSRCRYHLYYRATASEVQILALWHTSRGRGPAL